MIMFVDVLQLPLLLSPEDFAHHRGLSVDSTREKIHKSVISTYMNDHWAYTPREIFAHIIPVIEPYTMPAHQTPLSTNSIANQLLVLLINRIHTGHNVLLANTNDNLNVTLDKKVLL